MTEYVHQPTLALGTIILNTDELEQIGKASGLDFRRHTVSLGTTITRYIFCARSMARSASPSGLRRMIDRIVGPADKLLKELRKMPGGQDFCELDLYDSAHLLFGGPDFDLSEYEEPVEINDYKSGYPQLQNLLFHAAKEKYIQMPDISVLSEAIENLLIAAEWASESTYSKGGPVSNTYLNNLIVETLDCFHRSGGKGTHTPNAISTVQCVIRITAKRLEKLGVDTARLLYGNDNPESVEERIKSAVSEMRKNTAG